MTGRVHAGPPAEHCERASPRQLADVEGAPTGGTTWAPVGQTPVDRRTGDRQSLNMISAVRRAD
jgi:hypothetical protein